MKPVSPPPSRRASSALFPTSPSRAIGVSAGGSVERPEDVRTCVYARTPYAFTAQDVETIAALSRLTTAGFAGALRGSQDLTLADHLLTALNSRQVIDHAIGIIIGQQHCTPEQAFAALRTISQTRKRPAARRCGGAGPGRRPTATARRRRLRSPRPERRGAAPPA